MKAFVYLSIPLLLLAACRKEPPAVVCNSNYVSLDYSQQSGALIPINTRNFWTYTDSLFDPVTGAWSETRSTQINIKAVFELGGLTYFHFTEMLSPMTLIGDSLVAVDATPSGSNCYTLGRKLFPVTDTVQLENPNQFLYPDTATVLTAAGSFANNIVYKEGNSFEMVFHPGTGLIKLRTILANGQQRRVLTLKDYRIQP
jgi:hypothetical protein